MNGVVCLYSGCPLILVLEIKTNKREEEGEETRRDLVCVHACLCSDRWWRSRESKSSQLEAPLQPSHQLFIFPHARDTGINVLTQVFTIALADDDKAVPSFFTLSYDHCCGQCALIHMHRYTGSSIPSPPGTDGKKLLYFDHRVIAVVKESIAELALQGLVSSPLLSFPLPGLFFFLFFFRMI